jgi:hypothetical protein
MRKSKVSVEKYNIMHADLIKIMSLQPNQQITDISVCGKTSTNPWSLVITVETTDSTNIEVPSYTSEK